MSPNSALLLVRQIMTLLFYALLWYYWGYYWNEMGEHEGWRVLRITPFSLFYFLIFLLSIFIFLFSYYLFLFSYFLFLFSYYNINMTDPNYKFDAHGSLEAYEIMRKETLLKAITS